MLNDAPRPGIFEQALLAYARHFPIRRGKLRVVNSLWRWAAGARGPERLARLSHGGFMVRCHLEEMLQRQFYFFGTYFLEDRLLDCWQTAAQNAAVVFDIGANAGIYSLAAFAARSDVTVHAFEPTPEIAAGLQETARRNELGRLHVHRVAVSDRPGRLVLRRYRGETGENGGMNFVVHEDASESAEYVACVSLDDFCSEQGIERIDLMKLDIQGQEAAALTGAARMIGEGRVGTIFMELNWSSEAREACPATESVGLLKAAGYVFSPAHGQMRFREAGDWLRTFSDIIARKPDVGTAAP